MTSGWDRLRSAARACPVTTAYVTLVVIIAVVLELVSPHTRETVVHECSTNLVNLRERPLQVLVLSAFVVPSFLSLWFMVVTVCVGFVAECWLGHLAVATAFVIGHFGATLFVAVLLFAGIYHHQIDPSVGRVDDVGVSYGTFAVLGLATAAMWGWRRAAVVGAAYSYLVLTLLADSGFTAVGHLTALTLGLMLAALVRAGGRAPLSRGSGARRPEKMRAEAPGFEPGRDFEVPTALAVRRHRPD